MRRTDAGEYGKPHRMMAVWTAKHDNGWSTTVVENPDRSFAAWAARDGEDAGVDAVADQDHRAKLAAERALRHKTGHVRCSPGCSAWVLRTYAVFDRPRTRGKRRPARRTDAAA